MINELIKIANELDELGLTAEAAYLDSVISKNASDDSKWDDMKIQEIVDHMEGNGVRSMAFELGEYNISISRPRANSEC